MEGEIYLGIWIGITVCVIGFLGFWAGKSILKNWIIDIVNEHFSKK